jgi:hypothetical protein
MPATIRAGAASMRRIRENPTDIIAITLNT